MSQSRPAKVQEWTERIKRFRLSQATPAQFCHDEGVSMSSFCQWRKRIVESPIPTVLPRRSNSAQVIAAPLRAAKTEASSVRVTIESLGLIIDCHGDVVQNLDTVLTWASRQRQSGFKQFIVRN
jgi:hypothetical protein